jgi:hypothetical protein
MLYAMHILLESIDFCVKKPMILEIDNKGTFGFANNWSVGGRTCHTFHVNSRKKGSYTQNGFQLIK